MSRHHNKINIQHPNLALLDPMWIWSTNTLAKLLLYIKMQDGFSPLFAACQKGNTEIVDILIRAGANIHQVTTKVRSSTTVEHMQWL